MSSAPNIITNRQITERLLVKDKTKLSAGFVDLIFGLNDGKGDRIILENKKSKSDILELVSLVRVLGEESVAELIRNLSDSGKLLSLIDVVRYSSVFSLAKKQMFVSVTSGLKEKKKISSIVKCPKCGSNEVETRTVQTRSGDEASTDKNICRKCNLNFSIN
jgi:DNA-directed RNA polymerase subunit M/transcription elongation factor TFIIS